MSEAVKILLKDRVLEEDAMVGVLGGSFGVQAGASFIELGTAKNMIR